MGERTITRKLRIGFLKFRNQQLISLQALDPTKALVSHTQKRIMSNSKIFYLTVATGNYEAATNILSHYMRVFGYKAALDLVENIQINPNPAIRNQYQNIIKANVFLKAQLKFNPPILKKIANNVLTRCYHYILVFSAL